MEGRMGESNFIAERKLYAIAADGRGFEIHLAIGTPYQITKLEWACSSRVAGLLPDVKDVHGGDSWQALQLACQLAAQLLEYFVQDGGRLFQEEGGEPVQLSELFAKTSAF
jgi:hypothetical protein